MILLKQHHYLLKKIDVIDANVGRCQWYHDTKLKLRSKCKYYAQVQVNMLLESKTCELIIFNGATKEIVVVFVKYDEIFTTDLL